MGTSMRQGIGRSTVLRWLVWLIFVSAWTRALLMPIPPEWANWVQALLQPIPDQLLPGSAPPPQLKVFIFSKAVHVSAYMVLAILSAWLRVPWPYRWLLLVFISGHALGTEYMQHFVPGRHPSWRDVGLDHLGALLGVGLSWKWWRGGTVVFSQEPTSGPLAPSSGS